MTGSLKRLVCLFVFAFSSLAFLSLPTDTLHVVHAQGQSAYQALPASVAEKLVFQWFDRLNELDDWRITLDGKEPNEPNVERLLEMFDAGAYFQVGPGENQIGTVVYKGLEGIRKWLDNFSKSYVDLGYRLEYRTGKGNTVQLVNSVQPPWGGLSASAEFVAIYVNRRDRTRFVVPGAAFFIFDDAGKIQNLRIYSQTSELKVIE